MKSSELFALTGAVFIAPNLSPTVGLIIGMIYSTLSLIAAYKDK